MKTLEFLLLTALAMGPPATPVATVRLLPRATSASSILTLGNLAEIRCNSPERAEILRHIEISPSPAPGEVKWIDMNDVRDQLHRKGMDLTSLEFTGGRRIEVVGEPVREPPPEAPVAPSNWEKVITDMLKSNIIARTGWDPNKVSVTFDGKRALEFLERSCPAEWELLVPPRWQAGRQTVTLEIPGSGGEPTRFTLQTHVIVKRPVLFARRAIARGEAITMAHVELMDTAVDQETVGDMFIDPREVVGKVAARDITTGRPLGSRDVRTDPIVFRGSQVTVWIRHGSASVQMTAQAQEDGGRGDWITVVNPSTRKRLDQKVRVTGPQTAELTDDAPAADAGPERPRGARDGNFARRGG